MSKPASVASAKIKAETNLGLPDRRPDDINQAMIRAIILIAMTVHMVGCATPGIAMLPGGGYRVQPSDSASPMEFWEEAVVQRNDMSRKYLSHVLNTPEKTTLTIIDPTTMATLISCTQEDGRFKHAGLLRSGEIPPELPLAFLQLVAWPESAARNGLSPDLRLTTTAGVRTLSNGREVILIAEDLREAGRRITLPGYATKIHLRPISGP